MPGKLLNFLRDLLLLSFCLAIACTGIWTTRVIPPTAPVAPVTVYVCDYGIHSSLLLPIGDHMYVEYLYGDWIWAVQNQRGAVSGVRSMLFSHQAALGRRYLFVPPAAPTVMPPEHPDWVQPIMVDGNLCRKVLAELDTRYARQAASVIAVPLADGGFIYVKDDVRYGLFHDCNATTAGCLQEMGCGIIGWPVLSDFTAPQRTRVPDSTPSSIIETAPGKVLPGQTLPADFSQQGA